MENEAMMDFLSLDDAHYWVWVLEEIDSKSGSDDDDFDFKILKL